MAIFLKRNLSNYPVLQSNCTKETCWQFKNKLLSSLQLIPSPNYLHEDSLSTWHMVIMLFTQLTAAACPFGYVIYFYKGGCYRIMCQLYRRTWSLAFAYPGFAASQVLTFFWWLGVCHAFVYYPWVKLLIFYKEEESGNVEIWSPIKRLLIFSPLFWVLPTCG